MRRRNREGRDGITRRKTNRAKKREAKKRQRETRMLRLCFIRREKRVEKNAEEFYAHSEGEFKDNTYSRKTVSLVAEYIKLKERVCHVW